MTNKIIWIFNHYAITPDLPGGTRHHDIAKELHNRGYKTAIFASSYHHLLLKETKTYNDTAYITENHSGVRYIWLKTFPYFENNWRRFVNMITYSLRVPIIVNKIKEKPDLVIGSTVHPFAALIALAIAKQHSVPFIFEIRDLWPQTFVDMGIWRKTDIKSRLFELIERKLVMNSRNVITLSPLTEKYLNEKYKYSNCIYIPNGVDLKEYDGRNEMHENSVEKNETLKFLYELKTKGNTIFMYTGAIILSNNIGILIKAANIIKNYDKKEKIKIILVGQGQEKEKYESLIQKYKLTNIKILKPVKKCLVPLLLNYSDALLLVQGIVLWGSTNKLFDYLASGKPIITAVSCDHNNPIKDTRCGYPVPSDDPEALAATIMKMNDMDKEERDEMGQRGRKYVEKYHAIPTLADKLEDMLAKIFNSEYTTRRQEKPIVIKHL